VSELEKEFTIEDAVEAIKKKGGYSLDKELYSRWGVSKTAYSNWVSRDSLPISQGKRIAEIENISLDWFYLGRNTMKGHVSTNPFVDELAELVACLEMPQRDALMAFVQSMANSSQSRPMTGKAVTEAKLALIDFLLGHIEGPLGVGALRLNRKVGVISWIKGRKHERFTMDELLYMVEDLSRDESNKKKTLSVKVEWI